MDRTLLRDFWNCGDNEIIQFALMRAHLNRLEKEVLILLLDECYTQEEAAEHMNYSTRKVQDLWYSASTKLLSIPWLTAYATELRQQISSSQRES